MRLARHDLEPLVGRRRGREERARVVGERLVVRCDRPLPLQVDGEDLGDVETAVFEAEREAVVVLVESVV